MTAYLHILRDSLEGCWPGAVRPELKCSCGAENHACMHFFSIAGHPAAVVLPEARTLTAEELESHLGYGPVAPLTLDEMESAFADTELGHSFWFENPFGFSVYLDAAMAGWRDLVFCPRMFLGGPDQCIRVPTERFVALTHPVVVPLATRPANEANAWAV